MWEPLQSNLKILLSITLNKTRFLLFLLSLCFPFLDPDFSCFFLLPLAYFFKKFGTVGAVALDSQGNIAAGTSTGGMTNKRFGRIGDSPVVGAGTYANNATCAISCTGHGEYFLRAAVAHDISCLIEYKGLSLNEACDFVIKDKLKKMGGEGGLIAINALGDSCFSYNSTGMNRGMRNSEGQEIVAFYGA